MATPKISVAMAAYNGEKYIEEQLLSILRQELPPDEVVICDDASTDNTRAIIRNFIDAHHLNHWTLIENKVNIGCYDNFLQAIKYTAGEYIFFSDQDDIWLKEKTKKMVSLMDANDEILALASDLRVIDEAGHVIIDGYFASDRFREKHKPSLIPISLQHFIQKGGYYGTCMAIRSKVRDMILRNAVHIYPFGHDGLANITSCAIGQMYFYNECLVKYRIHKSNLSGIRLINQNGRSQREDRVQFLNRYQYYIEKSLDVLVQLENDGYQLYDSKKTIEQIIILYKIRLAGLTNRRLLQQLLLITKISDHYKLASYLGDIAYILRLDKALGSIWDSYKRRSIFK